MEFPFLELLPELRTETRRRTAWSDRWRLGLTSKGMMQEDATSFAFPERWHTQLECAEQERRYWAMRSLVKLGVHLWPGVPESCSVFVDDGYMCILQAIWTEQRVDLPEPISLLNAQCPGAELCYSRQRDARAGAVSTPIPHEHGYRTYRYAAGLTDDAIRAACNIILYRGHCWLRDNGRAPLACII